MAFQPPLESQRQLAGIDFASAIPFAQAAKQRFDAFDATGTKDPNRCKALLKFPKEQAVFWSSKMAIDADGPAGGTGRFSGKQLDPANGQDATSLMPIGGQKDGLPSETVPYIVLPKLVADMNDPRTFDPLVAIGDVAMVVFKEKIAAAICGDLGPFQKIGEASIRVHEVLQSLSKLNPCRDPCLARDAHGYATQARDSSVEEDVLFFVFPNSKFAEGELTYENIETKICERAFYLYNALRGATARRGLLSRLFG
ncbi:glycoside hydrolase family 75 protein [Microbacteriaceae bacterium K1510]|nr:glycoside hydrolase family 75 protein [Microbacteriaceae bacterium K1510]